MSACISIAFLVVSCYKNNGRDYNNSSNMAKKVSISATGYSPATLTVASGSTVTWTNTDNMVHTVTTADGKISSGDIAAGSSFSQAFTTTGTFNYFDSHNTTMSGVVTVTTSSPGGGGY